MTVSRRTPLPAGPATGRLLVADNVGPATSAALQASSANHRSHEGLVLWLGRTIGDDTIVMSVAVPPTDHRVDGVFVGERAVLATSRAAGGLGIGLVAQVHSHPGRDTRHSDGDDHLIVMPYEGMFSLVIADYGHGGLLPAEGAGLHQYQHGRWVHVTSPGLIIIPTVVPIGATR